MWNKIVIITILMKSVWWPYIQSVCWCYCCASSVHTESEWMSSSTNWCTYVTPQSNKCELPEDDAIVSKHVGAY